MEQLTLGRQIHRVSNLLDRRINHIPLYFQGENLTYMQRMIIIFVHYRSRKGDVFQRDLEKAIGYAEETDLMLVGGTSLVVYPVAGLVEYLRPSAKLVILNRDPTPYDSRADLILRGDLGEELEAAVCP